MPADELKLVVPNGNLKLSIAFRNGIVAAMDGQVFTSKEQNINLTGLADVPVILDVEKDAATGTIAVRMVLIVFHISLNEIQNKIYPLKDILGSIARQLEEQISNVQSVAGKVSLLQKFLFNQFTQQQEDY